MWARWPATWNAERCRDRNCIDNKFVINSVVQTGIVPDDFKQANVTPIFKERAKHELDNYRPVSVLPICSKVFERLVHRQISQQLEEKELLSPTPFGFRKNRNMELAATLLLDKIRENTDKGDDRCYLYRS